MRTIKRPDSTTICFEFMFHLLKDKTEVDNILEGKTTSDIIGVLKYVDQETFQPLVAFWLKDTGYGYVSTLENIYPHNIDFTKCDSIIMKPPVKAVAPLPLS